MWNYRIVKKENVYGIHEAFYDSDGKIEAITENAVNPHGETKDDLIEDLDLMLRAVFKDVIDYESVGK